MKKMIWMVCMVFITTQVSTAVVTIGSGDPTNNTTPPNGDRGWGTQCRWGMTAATVISSNYFLAAKHVGGNVGNKVLFHDVEYVTINKIDDPEGRDLTLWKIQGSFPTNSWAQIYEGTVGPGMAITMFGNGFQRGKAVYRQENIIAVPGTSLLISNFIRGSMVEFDVIGCNVGTRFVVQQNTDLSTTNWITGPDDYVATTNVVHVSIEVTSDPQMFYRIMSCQNLITNQTLVGWELREVDLVLRWGTNEVYEIDQWSFSSMFDQESGGDEGCITPFDSSGGCFILDNDRNWKLAGVNILVDVGPYSNDGGLSWFNGTMMDISGLTLGYYDTSTGQIVKLFDIPREWGVTPQKSTYSLIPVNWVMSTIIQ